MIGIKKNSSEVLVRKGISEELLPQVNSYILRFYGSLSKQNFERIQENAECTMLKDKLRIPRISTLRGALQHKNRRITFV